MRRLRPLSFAGLLIPALALAQDGWNPVAFPPTAPAPPAHSIPPVNPADPGSGGDQPLAPVAKRMVFKRIVSERLFGLDGFEVFTGEGEEAKLSGFVVKSVLGDQFNVKETRETGNAKAYFKARRGGGYSFFKEASSNDLRPPALLELRPGGNGYDVYNRSGQLFARIRWESREEVDGSKVVQRVFYSSEGQLPSWSIVKATFNESPGLSIRRSAGRAAVPAYQLVLQDWAPAPAAPRAGAGAPGFDDLGLGSGPAPVAAANIPALDPSDRYLIGAGVFMDAWIASKAWRDAVGMPQVGE